MKRTSRHLILLLPIALGAGILPAAPILIDDFSDDLAPVMANATFDGTMLGGELDISLFNFDMATFEINGGIGRISGVTETGGSNNAQLVYDGDDNSNGYSFHLLNADFTDGGSNDHFAIELTSVTGSIDIIIRLWEDGSTYSDLEITDVTDAGTLEFPFEDFFDANGGADFAAAKNVIIYIFLDTGEGFEIDSFMATGPTPPTSSLSPFDKTPPAVKLLKKKKLKSPRPRHSLKGTVADNGTVATVEVKSRLQKGWRRAKLSSSGKWKFRTPRLKSGKNRFLIRARDVEGNISKTARAKAKGS